MYKKVTKVEEAVYDAKLVKNLSAICKRNLEMLSTNAVTFKPVDFAKKLIQKLTPNDNSDVMSQAKLLSLGQEVNPKLTCKRRKNHKKLKIILLKIKTWCKNR